MKKIILYKLDLSNWDPQNCSYLTGKDLLDVANYKSAKYQKEHLASLYLKRRFIGAFQISEFGKPISQNVFFSIAHSGDYLICGVSFHHSIGVDLELIKPVKEGILDNTLNEEEKMQCNTDEEFYLLWTQKESLAKCEGHGMNPHPTDIPGLPMVGQVEYQNKTYYRTSWINGVYAYSICLAEEDFEVVPVLVNDNESFVGEMKAPDNIRHLYQKLALAWDSDTCAPRMRKEYYENHPSYGQCSVTAYLVQDLLGGDVRSIKLADGSNHCFNIIDSSLYDFTSAQFNGPINYEPNERRTFEELLQNTEKYERFLLLKKRIDSKGE